MSGQLLTAEQAQELAGEGEPTPRRSEPGIQLVPIPCTILVQDWGILDCPGDNSWGYTPYGVFATGVKRGHDYGDQTPAEHDVLFPYNAITAVEFDYPAYFAAQGLDSEGNELRAAGEGGGNLELSVPNQEGESDGDPDSGD